MGLGGGGFLTFSIREDVRAIAPMLVANEEAPLGCIEEHVRVDSIVMLIYILPGAGGPAG